MFPGVDGFHWTAGHLVFLGLFFSVLGTVAATLATAAIRAGRGCQERLIEQLRWTGAFHDLPERDRACRHELTGEFRHRICQLKFDCQECETHVKLMTKQSVQSGDEIIFGMRFPLDRLYHRGHTWARAEADGTFTIGLDELGRRLMGEPDTLELPGIGARLEVNGTAWHMEKNGARVRLLSPIEGEVLETGDPAQTEWLLKVKPADTRTTHLLRGAELNAWIRREVEKLQLVMADGSLADGGEIVEDVSRVCPRDQWDRALAAIFLES